jgi:hypothetical protein
MARRGTATRRRRRGFEFFVDTLDFINRFGRPAARMATLAGGEVSFGGLLALVMFTFVMFTFVMFAFQTLAAGIARRFQIDDVIRQCRTAHALRTLRFIPTRSWTAGATLKIFFVHHTRFLAVLRWPRLAIFEQALANTPRWSRW